MKLHPLLFFAFIFLLASCGASHEEAQTQFELGLEAGQSGDWARAEAHFRKAISHDPDFAEAYLRQAQALNRLRRETEANSVYREALGLYQAQSKENPADFDPHVQAAFCYLLLDMRDHMKAELDVAVTKGLEQGIADQIIAQAADERERWIQGES